MAKKPNWKKISTEYITGDISQRDLAKKHGVPFRTLQDRCRAEGWVAQKKEHRAKAVSMACEMIAESQARDTAALITQSAEKLLEAANTAISQLQTPVTAWKCEEETANGKITREYLALDPGSTGAVDAKALRNIAGALKDIAQILNLRPQLDQEEQEARIAALRAKAAAQEGDSQDDGEIRLVMVNNAEDYIG